MSLTQEGHVLYQDRGREPRRLAHMEPGWGELGAMSNL